MDDKRWLENLGKLADRADKFADEDVLARELADDIRVLLRQLANHETNFEMYLKGLGPGGQATTGKERHESERNQTKATLKEKERELSRHVANLESIARSTRLSAESISISKRMLFVSVISVFATLIGLAAAGWMIWESRNLAELTAKQAASAPFDRPESPVASPQAPAPPTPTPQPSAVERPVKMESLNPAIAPKTNAPVSPTEIQSDDREQDSSDSAKSSDEPDESEAKVVEPTK